VRSSLNATHQQADNIKTVEQNFSGENVVNHEKITNESTYFADHTSVPKFEGYELVPKCCTAHMALLGGRDLLQCQGIVCFALACLNQTGTETLSMAEHDRTMLGRHEIRVVCRF
jgi:hypothetical protein